MGEVKYLSRGFSKTFSTKDGTQIRPGDKIQIYLPTVAWSDEDGWIDYGEFSLGTGNDIGIETAIDICRTGKGIYWKPGESLDHYRIVAPDGRVLFDPQGK